MFLRLVIPRDLRPCWSLTGRARQLRLRTSQPDLVLCAACASATGCPMTGWHRVPLCTRSRTPLKRAFEGSGWAGPRAGLSGSGLLARSRVESQERRFSQCDPFGLVKQLVRQSVGSTERSRCRDGSRPACSRDGFRRCWPTWRESGSARAASAKRGAYMQMIDLVVSPSRSDRDACGNLFADTPAGRSRPSGRTGPRGLHCLNGGKPRRAGQLASLRSVLTKGSGAYPGLSVGSAFGRRAAARHAFCRMFAGSQAGASSSVKARRSPRMITSSPSVAPGAT